MTPPRVALLLVSHSQALARATAALAAQMTGGAVVLDCAAGCGPDHGDLGTDPLLVQERLAALDTAAGTLVLVDLGSALLSADMALDMVEPDLKARARLVAAPFVEGAVAAAVAAAAGLPLDAVAAEARQALAPKQAQLGETPPQAAPEATPPSPPPANLPEAVAEAVIRDPHGLHARPAARLAVAAAAFTAELFVSDAETGKGPAPARSLVALGTLGARSGHRLRISGRGGDAPQAVKALADLIASFTGADTPPPPAAPPEQGRALPVSPGIAIGPLRVWRPADPVVSETLSADPEADLRRLSAALDQAAAALEREAAGPGGDILAVQAVFLRDPDLRTAATALILGQRRNAADAMARAGAEAAARFAALEDAVLRARAADLRDATRRVLTLLSGAPAQPALPPGPPAILVAEDLPPSLAQTLDPARVLGVIDRRGGATSHAAILLRGLKIPALAGAAALLPAELPASAAFDGGSGELIFDPDAQQIAAFAARRPAARAVAPLSGGCVALPGGGKVELWANVTGPRDAALARAAGAFGIGLLRTEMLFLDRADAPDEAEQTARLAEIFALFSGRPITVRTLDAGGDKPMPYLAMPPEANPFLGVRGLRLSLARPALFRTQLRAILTAGVGHDLRIMLPMVTEAAEVTEARTHLDAAHQSLSEQGIPHAWPVPLGVMVEVPAAALTADALAEVADFFSIGTNDLTQYTLAAERGHPALARFAEASHPAVLALIRQVAEAGRRHGRHVAVCGEAAGQPATARLLVAAGVPALSLSAALFPEVIAALGGEAAKPL
ncbi:phosphoenolpyruvate-protein phosphotransferase [mine drainage metagenome]|uniref:Phosphoenolpyruvate-protein phosphotransferase n=1 Tax=mine drainage metagenome TaxID=410659 RepID=A0A1J5S2M4_9ZZZZ